MTLRSFSNFFAGAEVPLLMALASCALLVWSVVAPLTLYKLGYWFLVRGKRSAVRRVCGWVWFIPKRARWSVSDWLRIRATSDDGNADEAVDLLEECVEARNRASATIMALACVDIWVNAGQYRKALRVIRMNPDRRKLRARQPGLYGVIQVNRAEALHNLGRNELALKLLLRTRRYAKHSALGRNGALTLEAWVLAQRGEGERARHVLTELDPKPLSPYYAAEVHFTRAAVELSCGRFEVARTLAELGVAHSVRRSSERNGQFLLGKIELARGDLAKALTHYEAGRAHLYRRQGGASLGELAELYEKLDRIDDARGVYAEAILRDPESFAAVRCRVRLAQLSLPTLEVATSP
jgi:tetratricopeptide (TPR) repeat protein